ncbi:MAG: DUF2240 family protein [Candidatus Thalassarchaeaceae archaeon]|jgi:hypothetical protein|nr:DUF2240 family protein [Candidatus Thalassarchaeaceae archaeon]
MLEDSDISPDLANLLAQTWKSSCEESIGLEEICRIWSYDLGWFEIQKAIEVRTNLIESGWLVTEGEYIRPAIDITGIDVPFTWMPVMRILDNPPQFVKSASENLVKRGKEQADLSVETIERKERPVDPIVAHIKKLLEEISKISGLEKKEVMRRAQRKRKALGPVTLWMTLLLVAREQKLPMHPILQNIS